MTLPGAVTVTDDPGGIHGAGISAGQAKTLSTWSDASPNGAGFNFTNVWEWDTSGSYMPRLRGSGVWVPWPYYLQ
jgi:hypothetical protein